MTRLQSAAIALLAALLVTTATPAPARDGVLVSLATDAGKISVDQMPPIMRTAYLKGIRDELIAHGYDSGPDNNAFGKRFTAAIRRYQLDADLRPDGIASKELLEHLLFALPKIYADGSRAVPAHAAIPGNPANTRIVLAPPARTMRRRTGEPVPAPAPRGRVLAKPLPDDRSASTRAVPRLDRRPDPRPAIRAPRAGSGGFVSQTQRALRDRGYYQGPVDGRYSDGLADAIRAFQKNNRLPVTGVIDGPLLEALS
jgi:peptidoglycan hydrolase-like protein with peptidoglycan-binding domain